MWKSVAVGDGGAVVAVAAVDAELDDTVAAIVDGVVEVAGHEIAHGVVVGAFYTVAPLAGAVVDFVVEVEDAVAETVAFEPAAAPIRISGRRAGGGKCGKAEKSRNKKLFHEDSLREV